MMPGRPHTLLARLDSTGDVLLQGPAVRAVAAGSRRVSLLCGPRGAEAAQLLPGVDDVLLFRAEWIDPEPQPVTRQTIEALVDQVTELRPEVGIILTSFHQSPLPLALLLRLAGVERLAAISEDYPGSLLDLRHRVPDEVHEVERSLSLVRAAGYDLPAGDDGSLRVRLGGRLPPEVALHRPYVAVHPAAAAPARTWSAAHHRELVDLLVSTGRRVLVTGSEEEAELTAEVAGPPRAQVLDLGGRTPLPVLAEVLAEADAVVVGNTGPAHLAAAVGTPIVSLFAPVVPAVRWRPWRVPHMLLGRQDAPCADSRAWVCPIPGHPCLDSVTPAEVAAALESLTSSPRAGAA